MTWLITGGSGQLGLALQVELKLRDIDFVSVNSHDIDVTNQMSVERVFDSVKPNTVINAAAWTDVDGAETHEPEAYAANALGPQNLAIAARNMSARLVQVSTDHVFSGPGTVPWDENAEHNPQSVYGSTKSMGEKFVLDIYSTRSYIVRTAWLYSADRKNFAKAMVKLALNGTSEVRVVNDQIGQPTLATDLAKQIVTLILSNSPTGIYHGTSSGQASRFDFAKEIFRLTGADVSRVIPVSSIEYPMQAKRPSYSVLSHDAWDKAKVQPMRYWQLALAEAMPSIISAVKLEG
jgi:dTDP-4-dehydrorhamnose reductase